MYVNFCKFEVKKNWRMVSFVHRPESIVRNETAISNFNRDLQHTRRKSDLFDGDDRKTHIYWWDYH